MGPVREAILSDFCLSMKWNTTQKEKQSEEIKKKIINNEGIA